MADGVHKAVEAAPASGSAPHRRSHFLVALGLGGGLTLAGVAGGYLMAPRSSDPDGRSIMDAVGAATPESEARTPGSTQTVTAERETPQRMIRNGRTVATGYVDDNGHPITVTYGPRHGNTMPNGQVCHFTRNPGDTFALKGGEAVARMTDTIGRPFESYMTEHALAAKGGNPIAVVTGTCHYPAHRSE
jgi:hypothetical protein